MTMMEKNPVTPQVRNLSFPVEAAPKYWFGGDPALTVLFNALSTLFPEGEKFFIRSVRHFADQITDPKLAEDVRLFSGQEAMHSREHARLNAHIAAEWGGLVARNERKISGGLRWAEKRMTPHWRLAVTCAVEHWTAMLAEAVLSSPEALQDATDDMAAIWRWHAQEEIEHKAVAFDVYKAVGGSYWLRALVMIQESISFLSVLTIMINTLLKADNQPRFRSWMRILRYAWFRPLSGPKLFWRWLAYFSPRFHPWQQDDRPLLAEVRY
jgi:uncharacterized protein